MNLANDEVSRLISLLTIEEKIALLAGANFWEITANSRLNLRSVTLNDGPFGLRKPEILTTGAIGEKTIAATSFPTTSLLASTFNPNLIKEMGKMLGNECNDQGVDILLGPGINLKRSPLCGRNFEYFSEDPLVTSTLACALVEGIQSEGAGACIKHFAANNQENMRFSVNAIIDERALNELYLKGFKDVLKTNPRAVMCSYNYLNGIKVSENHFLLTEKLRNEFNYEGLLISDWGAVSNPLASVKAGLNLEMPGPSVDQEQIIRALKEGELTIEELDKAIRPQVALAFQLSNRSQKPTVCDYDVNYRLAQKIAEDGAVLLKNDDEVLPLRNNKTIALIGDFAKAPHYQGLGSSAVTPTKESSLYCEFLANGLDFSFAPGYEPNEITPNKQLIQAAVELAKDKEIVVLAVGLPEPYEVEGTDRVRLDLPPSHVALIEAVSKVNKNVIILLTAGAPVVMNWLGKVKAVLHMHLPGSAGASAAFNLLFGKNNPSGKLAESYPKQIEDTPTADTFWQSKRNMPYYESIYVGYRYYEAANINVLFPFGYGLSYTRFELGNIAFHYDHERKEFVISLTIKNIGNYAGAEVIQVYVGKQTSKTFNPKKELRAFQKVFVKKEETKEVQLKVKVDELMFYDSFNHKWTLENTTYEFYLGTSSVNSKKIGAYTIDYGDDLAHYEGFNNLVPHYFKLNQSTPFSDLSDEFGKLFGGPLPLVSNYSKRPFTNEVSLEDTKAYAIGRKLCRKALRHVKSDEYKGKNYAPFLAENILKLPLRSFVELTNREFTYDQVEGLRLILNGEKKKGMILLKSGKGRLF